MKNKINNNQVATQNDIYGIKKEDVKKLASKTGLKKVERNLRSDILRVEERVENVEEKMQTLQEGQEDIKQTLSKLQNTLLESSTHAA